MIYVKMFQMKLLELFHIKSLVIVLIGIFNCFADENFDQSSTKKTIDECNFELDIMKKSLKKLNFKNDIVKKNDAEEISRAIVFCEENLYMLNTKLSELRRLIDAYVFNLNNEKSKMSKIISSIYYIERCIKFGFDMSRNNYVQQIIIFKSIVEKLRHANDSVMAKIDDLKKIGHEINENVKELKEKNNYLIKMRDELLETVSNAKNFSDFSNKSDELKRIQNIATKVDSISDLLSELEAEEYVGFLKNSLNLLNQNKSFKFSYPKVCSRKIDSERKCIIFHSKPACKIFSPECGIVIFCGKMDGQNIIIIKNSPKFKIIISGIAIAKVSIGDYVHQNQEIALLPDSINDEVEFSMQIIEDGMPADPIKYFK